jgi:hypothetical protein
MNETDSFLINGSSSSSPTTTMNATSGAASNVLAIDPAHVTFVEVAPPVTESANSSSSNNLDAQDTTEDLLRSIPFVNMFRGSANYIANHRNTVAVYHIPGGLVTNEAVFRDLMNDVTLTWLLGMRIVLVAGCRHQIRQRLEEISSSESSVHHGLRVTDAECLRIVKEEAGYVRFEVERQLARSLRMQGGVATGGAATKGGSSSTAASNDHGYYDG